MFWFMKHVLLLTSILLCTFLLCSCGNNNSVPDYGVDYGVNDNSTPASCVTAKIAQIVVLDGFLQNICGCQETPKVTAAGSSFVCTVPAGTVVYFQYSGTVLAHQLISNGTPSFPSSPLSDPGDLKHPLVRSHAVVMNSSGSYNFSDAFNGALSGVIVVQ